MDAHGLKKTEGRLDQLYDQMKINKEFLEQEWERRAA
jgi:hypothetical protein